jgi:N6-L-threonylcarbamoyladenine synthase
VPSLASCTDNAAMIAYAGALRLARGERDDLSFSTSTRTDLLRVTRKGGGKRIPEIHDEASIGSARSRHR